jgi:hypothetical protein
MNLGGCRVLPPKQYHAVSRKSAALRNFSPLYVGYGSLATQAGEADARPLCPESGQRADISVVRLCQSGRPCAASKLKCDVLPLGVTQIAQSLPELPPKPFWIDIAND